jgi:hypothetical protein
MRLTSHPASHLQVGEVTAMARYFAFFVFGCAFTVGVLGMVETHHVSNAAPLVTYQSAH